MVCRTTAAVASLRAAVRRPRRRPLVRLALLGSGLIACLLPGVPAAAEVRAAAGGQSLGTRVNGVAGGSCTAGLCEVSGGTRADSNLFHRFSTFDTRGEISGVTILNGTARNVIVGVTDPLGSFIDKPVSLASSGNLVWLSPGGVAISGAGGFREVARLNLSTGTGLRLANGVFDASTTDASQAAALTGAPVWDRLGVVNDPASLAALGLTTNGDLSLSGGMLTVDQSLLLDAQGGNVVLQAAGLQVVGGQVEVNGNQLTLNQASVDVSDPDGMGGSITVTGDSIALLGSSLQADGSAGGGQILLGGDERGANPAVPNARRLYADAGTQIGADGLGAGSGGRVILYSMEFTQADARLSARGGDEGGDGGFVETSGGYLSVSSAPDLLAPKGQYGEWLIDPWDIEIVSAASYASLTSVNPFSCLVESPLLPSLGPYQFNWPAPLPSAASGFATTYINATTLGAALSASSVTVSTAIVQANTLGTGTGSGNIVVTAPISTNAISQTLSLQAQNQIILNADITNEATSGSLYLDLVAPAGVQWGNAILAGPMEVSVKQFVSSPINDGLIQVSGSGSFLGGSSGLSTLNARSMAIPSGKSFRVGSNAYVNLDGVTPIPPAQSGSSGLDVLGTLVLDPNSTIAIGGGAFGNSGFIDAGDNSKIYVGTSSGNFTNTGDGSFTNNSTGLLYLGVPFGPTSPSLSAVSVYASVFSNLGSIRYDLVASPSITSDLLNVFGPGPQYSTSTVNLGGSLDPTLYGSLSGSATWDLVNAGQINGSFSSIGSLGGSSSVVPFPGGQGYFFTYSSSPSPPPDPTPPPPDPTPPPSDPTSPPPDPMPPEPTPTPIDVSIAVQQPAIGSVLNQPVLQPSTMQTSVSGLDSIFVTSPAVSTSTQAEPSSGGGSGLTTTTASFETADPFAAEPSLGGKPAVASESAPAQGAMATEATDDQQKKDQTEAQSSNGQSPEADASAVLKGAEAVRPVQAASLALFGQGASPEAGSAPLQINLGGLEADGSRAQPMAAAQVSDSNRESDARAGDMNRALNTDVAPADEEQQRAALEANQRPLQPAPTSSVQGANLGGPANTVGGTGRGAGGPGDGTGPGAGAGQGRGPGFGVEPGARP